MVEFTVFRGYGGRLVLFFGGGGEELRERNGHC